MMTKKMEDAVNAQLQREIYSAYLYLSMSAYCESINLKGFASWLRVQAQEELQHALKFFDYLNERGARAALRAIDQPPQDFQSPREVFEQTLAHEKLITASIHRLYETALDEKDYATQNLLQWFITEQVEEEAHATEYVEKLRRIGESSSAIFWIDKELGKRGK